MASRFLTSLFCLTALWGNEGLDNAPFFLKGPVTEDTSTSSTEITFLNEDFLVSQGKGTYDTDPILIPDLKGVLLLSDKKDVVRRGADVEGFNVKDLDVPGGLEKLNQELGPLFIGGPLTKSKAMELKRQILLYYHEEGYLAMRVEVPEQSLGKGSLQLIVVESKLGRVIVQGNKHFPTRLYKGYVRQKPNESIVSKKILNDVAWMNRNPFREVMVSFPPGAEKNTSDIELNVHDEIPLRVYAGGDNTGINPTGVGRWVAGFDWGNALWLDHILTYQYSMAMVNQKFWSHNAHYTAPLSWRHVLYVYGEYAQIHPNITGQKTSAHSTQGSMRYQIPFKPTYKSVLQDLTLGFDFKNYNSGYFFSEHVSVPVVHAVSVTQIYLGYHLAGTNRYNDLNCTIEGFWSPGEMMGDQENPNFAAFHPGAKNYYVYGRLTVKDTWKFPYGFSLMTHLRGQISNRNLVPSEQFGLGGYNTVRGYDERDVNYDNAFCANAEFALPSTRLFRFLKKNKDDLTLLGFFDYGTGRNVVFKPGVAPQWQHFMSAGPALRYKIGEYLSVRVDWGFKLRSTQFSHLGTKVHVGVMANY